MTKRAMRRARARADAVRSAPAVRPALLKVTREHVAAFRAMRAPIKRCDPFALPSFPPGVAAGRSLAQDEALSSTGSWANEVLAAQQTDAALEGQYFLGYPLLSALAQRPEYRRIVETIATEMTRMWVRLINRKGDEQTQDRIDRLTDAMERLCVRDAFRKVAEGDGFFGRGHLYIALDGDQVGEELRSPIGNGRDAASRQKIRQGKLLRFQPVEAAWAYPQGYNSTNPLDAEWYAPTIWHVQGTPVHRSRLLTFIGREVPDLLKSAYAFGGLPMTQVARPYVENWLRTRQSVSDLIAQFSVSGVKGMNLADALASGGIENLQNRIDMFVAMRDNRGFMALNTGEDFFNVSTPLGTLDKLQAQAQEQIASICGIPLVKLLGVTPSGLNASSDGEVRVFYDFIKAYQEKLFSENLKRVIAIVQLSEFGDVDDDVGFEFEPLWQMSEIEKADVALKRAQAVMTAEPALDDDVVLRELREIGDATGVFTQITDEDIETAEIEAPEPEAGEADPGAAESLPVQARDTAEWDENKHPRADNGQFGAGGGGAGAKGKGGGGKTQEASSPDAKPRLAFVAGKATGGIELKYDAAKKAWIGDGVDADRIKALAIPPGWSGVQLSPDPSADLQVIAKDSKGRAQYRYSEAFANSKKAEKFDRVGQLSFQSPKVNEATQGDTEAGSHHAAAVRLMLLTGMRPGGDEDTQAKVKAHGATTLLKSHVSVEGDTISYAFTGKKGVHIENAVTDPALAKFIAGRLSEQDGDRLFRTDAGKANAYLKAQVGSDFKCKDLRTLAANTIAEQIVAAMPVPKTRKERQDAVNHVADMVSSQLGNTRSVALSDYINPAVFSPWGDKDAS